ncbi:hypothetical protein LIER_25313 [Lithospermum erythrorhizon]|uniref:Bidirectional sugar transporter SWEET n=1 Tax=Lithospermum erythrorhizon TaxID=34254 RepID=A0AAV3R8K1_LITER
MVFLAPLPTFYKIYQKKSSEGFQSIPYVIGLFSAMLMIYYAFLNPDPTLLITINSVGCFMHTVFICFYIFYASKKTKIQTMVMVFLLNICGLGLILVLTHFLSGGVARAHIVGRICLVFSLCVFVAPLCIVKQVIQTKSVEHMPFLVSLFLTLSAVMWFFYGLLRKDYNIAIPNVLGFTFGVAQMILYLIFKNKKKDEDVEQKLQGIETEMVKVIEETKIPDELKEQVIDVMKLSALVCSEIIPVVAQLTDPNNGLNNIDEINAVIKHAP